MRSKIELVFPTFLYRGAFAPKVSRNLNSDLTEEIATLRRLDSPGREWSRTHYPNGYSSYSSLDRLHNTSPNFGELETRLKPHVKKYVRQLNWDLQGRELRMTTCWANVMNRGAHHTLHLHPLCAISGVYYVSAPKGSSALKIEDPRMSSLMAAPPKRSKAPANQKNYMHFQPKPGDFLLFESWMRHEVPPHQVRDSRISVSFNYEWV